MKKSVLVAGALLMASVAQAGCWWSWWVGDDKSNKELQGCQLGIASECKEMTGAQVYYADPYTSCQRARNENNHLLVRRTSPKRHRLVHRSVKASMAAAEYINDYPRRKFGGRSSNEVHAALLASA